MKWLWIGFAIAWAFSVALDARRRRRAHAAPDMDAPIARSDAPIPALLSAKGAREARLRVETA